MRIHRDKATTSRIMSAVKGRGSKAEIALARAMWSLGLRYRKHYKKVIGRPDFAFPGPQVAVFCDGEFWHGKGWDKRGFSSWEAQFEGLNNADYWRNKIKCNLERDNQVNLQLKESGWTILRYLETDILATPEKYAREVHETIQKVKGLK